MTASSPHWKRPPAASVEAIWEAAATVLGPNGQVRLEDVSDATGIPRATVYYYFPGRDPFVQWVVHEELERARAVLDAGSIERTALTLFDRWRRSPALARRLFDGVGSEGWAALVGSVAVTLAGTERRPTRRHRSTAGALVGAVLASALSRDATRADVRRLVGSMAPGCF